jgi:hypothetical protein
MRATSLIFSIKRIANWRQIEAHSFDFCHWAQRHLKNLNVYSDDDGNENSKVGSA